jgi:TonB family protein
MNPSLGSLSNDHVANMGVIVLGDGSTALIVLQQTALAQMCVQLKRYGQDPFPEGFEAGGLLIGPEPQNGDLLVEGTIPLGMGNRSGNSLASLLQNELVTLGAREGSSQRPLGFYKAVSPDQIRGIDPNSLPGIDLAVPAFSCFQCCLVMAPSSSDISLRVLARNGGSWEQIQELTLEPTPEPSAPLEDPLLHNQGKMPKNEIGSPSVPAVQKAKHAEAADRTILRNRNRRRGLVVACALMVTAVVAFGSAYLWMTEKRVHARTNPQVAALTTSFTHFSASRDGAGWKLTWDPAVVETLRPTDGILSIQDGPAQQEIPLTHADLSSGTLYYSPTTGELAFGMQLLRDGIAVANERIRVLGGIKTINRPPDQFQRLRPPGQDRLPAGASPEEVYSGGNFAPAPTTQLNGGDPVVRHAVVRSFSPPISGAPPSELPVISTASAPLVAVALPVLPGSELQATLAAPPPPPPAPASGSVAASASAPTTALTSVPATATAPVPTRSVAVQPAQSNYVGPKPIKQLQPTASDVAGLHGTVELRVAVSANGKVTKITPVGAGRNFQLIAAATKAATFWEFQPARLDGLAVPSEMTVIFHF